MRAKDLVLFEHYRLKSTPKYGWIKVLRILPPHKDVNTKPYIVVECEHTVNKGDLMGFTRYFKPIDIVKDGA